jgi:hypothetical protein
MVTNCTNTNNKLITWLEKTKEFNISISIDGLDQRQEYIRYPSTWTQISKSLDFYIELARRKKNISITLYPTIQILNIDQLCDLIIFFEDKLYNEKINFSICWTLKLISPVIFDYEFAPKDYREYVAKKLSQEIKKIKNEESNCFISCPKYSQKRLNSIAYTLFDYTTFGCYVEGKKSIDTNKGTTTSKLTEGQRFTQEINQNINGEYYILIPADGSTEWMMNLGNHVSYKNVVGGRAMDEIHEIFRGYLDDDIALARDWKNRSSLKNVGSKAKELRFFKEILEDSAPKVLADINEMIEDPSTTNDEFEDYISKNIDAINDELIENIEGIFKTSQGKCSVEFFVEDPAEGMSVKLFSKSQKIAITEHLIFELEKIGSLSYELS